MADEGVSVDPLAGPDPSVLGRLLDDSQLIASDGLAWAVARAGERSGCRLVIHLADFEQQSLVPFTAHGEPPRERIAIEGTAAGRCFQTVAPVSGGDGGCRWWLPLIDGVQRLGVLEVLLPQPSPTPDRLPEEVGQRFRALASLIGHLIAVKAPYGDSILRARGARKRSVASDLLWALLPPLTFACPGLVVSAILEPSDRVAGDAFDYAVDGGTAHLAIFDATGHDMRAGLLSAVAVAAFRNARRRETPLPDLVRFVDGYVREHGELHRFVTAVIAELDLETGRLRYVIAGHPRPLILRRGQVVKTLSATVRPLLGLGSDDVTVGVEQLEPGDSLLMYTDGITEARGPDRTPFGVPRLIDTIERSARGESLAPEGLRRIAHAILEQQQGILQDDATLLIAQWSSGNEQQLRPA